MSSLAGVPDDPPRFVLAVDPGKTTGYAWLDSEDNFGYGEVEGRFDFYRLVREWTSTGAVPEIVCESWSVTEETHKKSTQQDPYLMWGYLEGLCDANGWTFDTQQPAQKAFGTDEKLKAIGWEATTKGGHARDASRHLLLYLTRRHGKPGQVGHDLLTRIMEALR